MKKQALQILREAVVDVLERYAFMFAEPGNGAEVKTAGSSFLHAAITYSGHASGSLTVTAPSSLCRQLAANVLGIDEESPEATQSAEDALKEFLNICCGQFAYALHGEEAVLNLAPPRALRVSLDKWHELMTEPEKVVFLVDDQPLLVTMTLAD